MKQPDRHLWAGTDALGTVRHDSAVNRSLRALEPELLPSISQGKISETSALFWCGVIAILLQFLLPYVVIEAMGIQTVNVKLHPATVLVIVAAGYAMLTGRLHLRRRFRESPGLLSFVIIVPFLALYSMYFTGFSGSALYPENYLSSGLLALLIEPASAKQKRLLAVILITICVANVLIGLFESLTFNNWFPLVIDPDAKLSEIDVDFRANAFYNHPLTASLITTMAIFLLYGMRLRFIIAAPVFTLFLIGLLSFGGRTALAVTLFTSVLTAFFVLLAGIVRRNLKLDFVLAIVAAAIVVPILVTFIVTQTTIADRIIDTLYYDDSADVRRIQWHVFGYLSLKDWLFGISHDDLNILKYQIGLGGKETDIENFWALMMLNLGAIGFLVFLAGFGAFLLHLARYARNMNGWLLVIAALIIDSGSNSLGVKSSDLFVEVAFIVAMSGYADQASTERSGSVPKPSLQTFRQPQLALGYTSTGRMRGLQALPSRVV